MSRTVLATKLYLPPPQPRAVPRPGLIERLNRGLCRKLTLVSAPAGFGKTTLVSEWVTDCGRPAAWLSLDEGDSDPTRFLTYFVAAVQTIAPCIGAGVLGALHASQPPPAESILTALLNEIVALPDEIILVLDNYHATDAKRVDNALAFVLVHLPPRMHLVVATREDPRLPLAQFRARGQLTELRAADLRFTPSEAAEFLNQVMDLNLSSDDITALESRTEGWIAGLQLAALSLQGRDDVPRFIRSFAGNKRYVVDYLVEEVLQRQPKRVRNFLLQTSILNRMSGPLCDAVTGQHDGRARLETLERGNLFVVAIENERQWYRYHHLFADVLQARAMEEHPDQIPIRHQLASAWYERHGLPLEAIRHALAAKDFERAANLIEQALPELRRGRLDATVLGWLRALPDGLIRGRPVLSVAYAWALLAGGELEGVESRLLDAEVCLDRSARSGETPDGSSDEMDQVYSDEYRHLPASIALYRAVCAQLMGDMPATVTQAQRVLDLSSEDDDLWGGAAAVILGLASWASGDLEAAHGTLTAGMARVQKAGNVSHAVSGAFVLADIRIAQGCLHEAMRTYQQALQLATREGEPVLRGTADLYVAMSELHREHNELDAATQHLLRGKGLGDHAGSAQYRYRWCAAMARVHQAQGDLDGALDLLYEAERLYVRDLPPDVHPCGGE